MCFKESNLLHGIPLLELLDGRNLFILGLILCSFFSSVFFLIAIPLILPEFNDGIVQMRFQIRERDYLTEMQP